LSLRWLDFLVVALYLGMVAFMGVRFSRRQTSTESYFVPKRSIPAWAMGMSRFATLISSVTFIAYPGSAYGNNWSMLVPGFLVLGVLARRQNDGRHLRRFVRRARHVAGPQHW
jgi:SSS family solute:Na+ symporter